MEVCQPLAEAANHPCHAIEQLGLMLNRLRQHHNPIQHFEDYENEVHALGPTFPRSFRKGMKLWIFTMRQNT